MEKLHTEVDLSQYKRELASLKRVSTQLHELRKWLLNVSLASLAFTFTVMFQVKDGGEIPNPLLAGFSISFLISAVIVGLFIRGKDELEKFTSDSKDILSLVPILHEMVNKSSEPSESNRHEMASLNSLVLSHAEHLKQSNSQEPSNMYGDLRLIVGEFVILSLGLVCLCLYVWRYLFNS